MNLHLPRKFNAMIEIVYVGIGVLLGFFMGIWYTTNSKRSLLRKLLYNLEVEIRKKVIEHSVSSDAAEKLLSYVHSLFKPLL